MMSDEWNAGVDAAGTSWGYGFVVMGYWLEKDKSCFASFSTERNEPAFTLHF